MARTPGEDTPAPTGPAEEGYSESYGDGHGDGYGEGYGEAYGDYAGPAVDLTHYAPEDDYAPSAPSSDVQIYGQQPPQDQDAEQAVLGAMLISKDAIAVAVETLRIDDFYKPAHREIYEVILQLFSAGTPVDQVTVANSLERKGELRRIGGPSYLVDLAMVVPTAANAGYYAEIVAERAVLRRLVDAGLRIVQYGYSGVEGADVAQIVDRAQAEIYEVTEQKQSEDYVALGDVLQPTLDEIDAIAQRDGTGHGVPTGLADLDELIHGLQGGQMIIIAARPGVGKSTLALDIMRSASIANNLTSVLFSLEMSRIEVTMRLLSAEAQVKLSDMRGGKMDQKSWEALARRMGEIAEKPLFVDDSPNMTMMEIRAKARRLKQQHDLSLIVVDYLQLMTSGKRVESRQQEVAEFSRSLKLLAKELDVPLIAISQLNRGPEGRQDKRPQVADLRESGSLEQDADIVLLIYRPELADDDPKAGQAELIIGKHRGGPTGAVDVVPQLHYSRFVSLPRGFGDL